MNELIPTIVSVLLDAAITICVLIFTGAFLPWVVKVGIPWLKDKRLYAVVAIFVKAAEKQAEAGTLTIPKLDYVTSMLEKKGITVTGEVRAMIEAAVKELDIAGKEMIGMLGDVFIEDEITTTESEPEQTE